MVLTKAVVVDVQYIAMFQAARQAIRDTWGSGNITNETIKMVFLLGDTNSDEEMELVKLENLEYGDNVMG